MGDKRFLLLLGLFLALAIFMTSSQTLEQGIISTDREIYSLSDTVTITLNYSDFENTKLEISDSKKTYTFLNPQTIIRYFPKEYGSHVVQFFKDLDVLDSYQFVVETPVQETPSEIIENDPEQTNLEISTDKQEYALGEAVLITLKLDDDFSKYYLELSTLDKTYKFFNLNTETIRFLPAMAGNYVLVLRKDEAIISQAGFFVKGETEEQIPEEEAEQPDILNETNAVEEFILTEKEPNFIELHEKPIRINDRKNNQINYKVFTLNKTEKQGMLSAASSNKKQRAVFEIEGSSIKKIDFENLVLNNDTALRLDTIDKPLDIENKKSFNAYAIDPSQLSFDNATVTATAEGTELWKCKEWDFENQLCLGSWVKLQDITPGEEYTFLLTAQDPGFAETGVATVNTKKPIYHPGETVELIMVVLDKYGYLVSGANISLTVVNPVNNEYLLTDITETKKGVYETTFAYSSYEGNYTLFVFAKGDNVDSNLSSYFTVLNYYDFDIIRDTPVTIDPWRQTFNSKINIVSFNYEGEFSYTEILPNTFSIISASDAIITQDDENILLTWNNLVNGSFVSYEAEVPKISPTLHLIGPSFISYNSTVFNEARPWFMAVDPAVKSPITSLSFYLNDYATGRSGNSYGPIDNNDFDEIPIEMNDYGNNNEKCEAWDCTGWTASTADSMGMYCTGGYDCTVWNGNSCDTWACTAWTQHTTAAQLRYCSGGWDCSAYNGNTCSAWDCTGWSSGTAQYDRFCTGEWDCTAWSGDSCATWACTVWSDAPGYRRDNYCSSGWSCVAWSGDYCDQWDCATWTAGGLRVDLYCSGEWDCSAWNGRVCSDWVCSGWSSGDQDDDFYCDNWLCSTWNDETNACAEWDCQSWVNPAITERDYYCSESWDCTSWRDLNKAPNVTALLYPPNYVNLSSQSIDFNFTVIEDFFNTPNCSLYMNISGWTIQGTIYNVSNNATKNITLSSPEGRFIWNINCFDNATTIKNGWYTSNYTVTIDRTGPVTSITDPLNFSNISADTYFITTTSSDALTRVDAVSFYYRRLPTDAWTYLSSDYTAPYRHQWDTASLQEGDTYQIRVYANDSISNIGLNYTVTNITINHPPRVRVLLPLQGASLNLTPNITIVTNITDFFSISAAYANITLPNGAVQIIPLTFASGSNYSTIFSNLSMRGRYNLTIYANDTKESINYSYTTYFMREAPPGQIIDLVSANLSYITYNVTVIQNQSGVLALRIRPSNIAIKEIIINNHSETSFSGPIRVQNSTNDGSLFTKTFMIDFSEVNMTSANVTITATGYHLHKCADFNITSLACNDYENYTEILSGMIPGENYTLVLYATDPGFGETIQGQSNISDSYIRQNAATTNYGGQTNIRVGKGTAAGAAFRGIIWFNLTNLPSGIQIRSANLSLYFYAIVSGDAVGNRDHGVHRVQQSPIRPWTETAVTWNVYNGTAWTTAGGDYSATATDTETFDNTRLNSFIVYNVTADVQLFTDNRSSNFGWIVRDENDATLRTRRDYYSKERTTASQRPKIDIYYEDIQQPGVILDIPVNNTNTTLPNITFYYNVTENIGFNNCSLYLNYQLNKTNTSIFNNLRNNFTLYNMPDATYYWNVTCYDSSGLVNSSGLKIITIDATGPETNITQPLNFTNITTDTYFIQASSFDSRGVDTVTFYYRRLPTDSFTFLSTDNTVPYRHDWDTTSLQEGDTYQVRAYANDSLGNSGANYTTHNISIVRPPVLSNIYPVGDYLNISSNLTISAVITDFFGISLAFVNITLPNGETKIINLSLTSANNYTGTFTNLTLKGRYNITFFANDTKGAINNSVTSYFIRTAPNNNLIDILKSDLSYIGYNTTIISNLSSILILRIKPTNHQIKEIIIHDYDERSQNNIIKLENYTNDVELFDRSYMIDLSGLNFTTANITVNSSGYHILKCLDFNSVTLRCNEDYAQFASGLTINSNYTFVLNATDPGFGETIQGQANISDSYFRQGASTTNFGGATNIRVGKSAASNAIRGIIWFNLTDLPSGTQIISANLSLYFYSIVSGDDLGNRTHIIHRVQQSPIRPWTELNVTWNNYNGTNAWTTPGGDYFAAQTSNRTFNNSQLNSFIAFNVTSDVQLFIDDLSSNFGWIIKDADESALNTRRDYRSSEWTTASQRPKLDIYYEDTAPPSVTLDLPTNNSYTNANTVTFYYNVLDNIGLVNCSLYLNYELNRTNFTVFNNQRNNFTLYNVGSSIYDWYVTCYDTSALVNSSGVKRIYVDTILPSIALGLPSDDQLVGSTLNFTFTPIDNLGYALNCSFIINNTNNQTGIVTNNNTLVNLQKTFNREGRYYWNVSCTDNATNTNTSETRNFIVSTAPPTPALISAIPNYTGLGQKILFRVNVTDTDGIEFVKVNVSKPDGNEIVGLYNSSGITFEGYFNNTWRIVVYNFTVLTRDLLGNENESGRYNFSVNASANINIKTQQDTYGPNNIVNLTRPDVAWWNTSWNYRVPITINTNSANRSDYPIEYILNFTKELNLLGGSGTIDNNSIRVVEWTDGVNKEVKSQFDNITNYQLNWASNAYGTLIWIMNGTTDYNQNRYYYVYFDTTANPKTGPNYYDAAEFNWTFNAGSTVIGNKYLTVTIGSAGEISDIRSRSGNSIDVVEDWFWNFFRTTNAWSLQSFTGTIASRNCGPVRCTVLDTGITGFTGVGTANTTYYVYSGSKEIRSFKGLRMATSYGMQVGDDLNVGGGYTFQATGSHPVNWIETDVMDNVNTGERTDRAGAYDYDTGFWAYRVTGANTDAYAVVRKYVKNETGKGISVPMHTNWWDNGEHAAGWENGYTPVTTPFIVGQDYQIANFYYVTAADDTDYTYAMWFYNTTINDATLTKGSGETKTTYTSDIVNYGNTNISGYLVMTIDSNVTGSWVYSSTVINDTNTVKLRNITLGSILELYNIWNGLGEGSGWNTGNTESGYYRARVELTDINGNVLQNGIGGYINASYSFYVDITPPVWYFINVTNSTPVPNAIVNFSANWTDNLGLNNWQFFWKVQGDPSFSLQDSGNFGGSYNWSIASKTIPATAEGKLIEFYFRAYDVQGASATTDIKNITVKDITNPSIVSPSVNPSKIYMNESVNISAIITDNIIMDRAWANITRPDSSSNIFFMDNASSSYSVIYSNTTLVGRYNVTIYANDTYDNKGTSALLQFDVYGRSNVSFLSPIGGSFPVYTLIDLRCSVFDHNTSQPVDNYRVEFYVNNSFIGSNRTDISGIAVRTWNITGIGYTSLNCTIQNSTSLYYDVLFDNANSSINILVPNITLVKLEHTNNVSYSLEEYETYDKILSINVTANNTGGANSTNVTTRLNVLNNLGAAAAWFNIQENSCANLSVGQLCTTQFNNSGVGYNITDLTNSGTHKWNIIFNWSNGGMPPNNFQRDFMVYHVPNNLSASLNRSEITPGELTKYLVNITNPWSKNLTGFNATINCPVVTGLSCSCYNQSGTKCNIGVAINRTQVQAMFNITTTASTPIGDYGINITVEYLNPGNIYHYWREIKPVVLQVKPLVAFIVSYPNNITRGDIFNLTGYSINIGTGTITNVRLNWTLPTGWENITGGLKLIQASLGPNEKFWNNITVNTSISVELGPRTLLLETYSPDANYDDDRVSIYVYGNTNISNITVSNQNPYRGETIYILARLRWDNTTDIVNQTVFFQTTYSNSTNATGWAVISYIIPSLAPLGQSSFRINVTYPGNGTIYSINSSASILISIRDRINISSIAEPRITGYGQKISINSNISSGILIDKAKANVTLPDSSKEVVGLYNTSAILFTGLFNNTWRRGQYNYTVFANNTGGYENESTVNNFEIRTNATFNYTTFSTLYGVNQVVNITGVLLNKWDNSNYNYRMAINVTETSGVSRTNTHFMVNFSMATNVLNISNENSTAMYCNGSQVPWDAYAVNTSGIWITKLEGIGEINISANTAKTCYVYIDNSYSGVELLPAYTGWMMAEQDKPGGVVCSLADSDVTSPNCFEYFSSISYSGTSVFDWCTSGDYETYIWNAWCYFKAPTTETETFGTRSDDSSYLYVNGSSVVTNGVACQAAADASGTYPILKDKYYPLRVLWNENGGSEEMRIFYNSTTYAGAGRNEIDSECYPFIGDEWSLTISRGISEQTVPQARLNDIGSTNTSGYLRMFVERNDSNVWTLISSVVNDTQTGKKRNVTFNSYLDVSSIWNGVGEGSGFNTLTRQTAQYRINTQLVDPYGLLLTNDDDSNITGYAYFWIDTTPPTVLLISPQNASWLKYQLINLSYLPNDTSLDYCYLWGNWSDLGWHNNETNSSPVSEIVNYFGPKIIPEGKHIWSVECFDSLGNSAFGSTNNLFVDITPPSIMLMYPVINDNVSYGNINFTFIVSDNLAQTLNCSLFINEQLTSSNINVQNGNTKGYVSPIYNAGLYNWTVNCTDSSGNSLKENANNFTVISGPAFLGINITSGNTSIRLNWSATQYAESYNIYISTNYTAGFAATPNITGITELNWTDYGAFDSERRYYKIAAVKGNASALSSITLGKHTAQLFTYWNLISVPFNLTNWQLYNGTGGRDIFTSPGDCIVGLWRYNSSDQTYQEIVYSNREWSPATGLGSESFTHLEQGRGYWAEVNNTCNLTLFGIVPVENSTFGLNTYWNIMGHYSAKDPLLEQESISNPIDVTPQDSVFAILRYNPILPDFEVTIHLPGFGWWPSGSNMDFVYLNPMLGYYFDVTQLANWTQDPNKG